MFKSIIIFKFIRRFFGELDLLRKNHREHTICSQSNHAKSSSLALSSYLGCSAHVLNLQIFTYSARNFIPDISHRPIKIRNFSSITFLPHRRTNVDYVDCSLLVRHLVKLASWCFLVQALDLGVRISRRDRRQADTSRGKEHGNM